MTAGRPPNIMRPQKLTTYLPEDLRVKLDLHLYSSVEGRVPHGAYTEFFATRIKEFFTKNPAPEEIAKAHSWNEEKAVKFLAMEGLLNEIALSDLRSGWTADRTAEVVRQARQITGKVPR